MPIIRPVSDVTPARLESETAAATDGREKMSPLYKDELRWMDAAGSSRNGGIVRASGSTVAIGVTGKSVTVVQSGLTSTVARPN